MTHHDSPAEGDMATMSPSGREVAIENLTIAFGGRDGVVATEGVSFVVKPGELVTIIGPSGCGKSTVLNAIASLVPKSQAEISGQILIGGEPVDPYSSGQTSRGLGYVFQRDSLLPWRTVAENVAMGLEIRDIGGSERRDRVAELLDMVGLTGFEDYYPHQISGGMRQRASLVRTLAYDPDIILMDEPFGALDAQTRMTLQAELIRIWFDAKKTILFVTHDLAEAITLGDRVISFSRQPGHIIADMAVPFQHPRDPFALFGASEFVEYQADVWREISDQFRASGATDEEVSS